MSSLRHAHYSNRDGQPGQKLMPRLNADFGEIPSQTPISRNPRCARLREPRHRRANRLCGLPSRNCRIRCLVAAEVSVTMTPIVPKSPVTIIPAIRRRSPIRSCGSVTLFTGLPIVVSVLQTLNFRFPCAHSCEAIIMKHDNYRGQNLRSARQRGTPLPPLPSHRPSIRPAKGRCEGDGGGARQHRFAEKYSKSFVQGREFHSRPCHPPSLVCLSLKQRESTNLNRQLGCRTRPEKYSYLVAAEGRAKISVPCGKSVSFKTACTKD